MPETRKLKHTTLCCVLLALITVAVYLPVIELGFVDFDDNFYLTANPKVQAGLTWEGVRWAFTSAHAANWHPVTWLSHMLDCQIYGLKPAGHHVTNLLFHTANTLLLFGLLKRLTGAAWRSALVAALFALHPLHVQSVAWVAERKDVLSGFFFMLTLLAYARYAEKSVVSDQSSVVRSREEGGKGQETESSLTHHASRITLHAPRYYLLSLLFFALGLMSKPMLVTLPFILLLLDYWPLSRSAECGVRSAESRKSWGGPASGRPWVWLVVEKLPFFALSAASCVVTVIVQKGGGAVVPVAVLAFPQRLANAILAYAAYLGQTFWPAHLAVLYPFGGDIPIGTLILSGAVVVAVTVWVVRCFGSRPYLTVGWFWFLGMLVPVIGLVQVGMQRMADRYTYLPLIGVFVMVAWGIPERLGRWRLSRGVLAAAASLILAACVTATSRELSYWKDSEHLFGRALEVAPANYIALDNYARALLKQHKLAEAIQSFSAAVALRPDLDASRCGLGSALLEQGKYAEAADQFTRVLELQPDHEVAQLQLGVIRGRQGRLAEAVEVFLRVLRVHPDDAGAHNNLGNVLAQQGKQEEAVRQFEETVRLKPDHAGAYNNLAISCRKLGRIGDAITHYREAIRLQPDSLEGLNNLAWLLAAHPDAQFRNGKEAVELATRACELTKYQNPIPMATLAAAYAETGRFQEAVSFAGQAQELAKGSPGALSNRLSAMLAAYQAGHPYYQM